MMRAKVQLTFITLTNVYDTLMIHGKLEPDIVRYGDQGIGFELVHHQGKELGITSRQG